MMKEKKPSQMDQIKLKQEELDWLKSILTGRTKTLDERSGKKKNQTLANFNLLLTLKSRLFCGLSTMS